ncbi:hypothetical protein K438DRAFT_1954215 [Mycena galopus ATCC 62051]|nr:hypothetical protein K438DRAFT_1954215 [Mycena galopus ATCC 62051]
MHMVLRPPPALRVLSSSVARVLAKIKDQARAPPRGQHKRLGLKEHADPLALGVLRPRPSFIDEVPCVWARAEIRVGAWRVREAARRQGEKYAYGIYVRERGYSIGCVVYPPQPWERVWSACTAFTSGTGKCHSRGAARTSWHHRSNGLHGIFGAEWAGCGLGFGVQEDVEDVGSMGVVSVDRDGDAPSVIEEARSRHTGSCKKKEMSRPPSM